ncbi:hypothetical protein [Streptomyces sp. NPDC006285]|uniref:hypothetical protein n=1 Tax=Streptomyces sp. NPDC006285 TaxID=3364742 RepID=UPI0036A20577
MTVGWGVRTARAAVFAAVCVLLAALGHVLMSGSAVPWWTVAGGYAVTGGVGWCLAGRERGLSLVVSVSVVAQGALHTVFAEAHPAGGDTGMSHAPHAGHAEHAGHAVHTAHGAHGAHATHMDHLGQLPHDAGGGTSSAGMLAAHVSAALLSGLWLAHGERAAFRLLRTVAGWLTVPLRPPAVVRPAAAPRPGRRPVRRRAERAPRLRRAHTIISRGPPTGSAVV